MFALKQGTLGLALAAMLSASAAQANTSCWNAKDIAAARVRQFEAMMLTVGLRCARNGNNFRDKVERFFEANKSAIGEADKHLEARYGANKSKAGRVDYDQYLTSLVNHYGSGRSDPQTCQTFSALAEALSVKSSDKEMLASISIEMVRDPRIDGTRCPAK